MSKVQSLEELKAENSQGPEVEPDKDELQDDTDGAAEGELGEGDDKDEDDEPGEGSESESGKVNEPWFEEEPDGDAEGKVVPLQSHINTRNKLKGKIADVEDENADLKRQLEELQNGSPKPSAVDVGEKPKREQFLEEEDPEEAYLDAVLEWRETKTLKESQAGQQRQQQLKVQQEVSDSVNDHYKRAEDLVKTAGIDESVYVSADKAFRESIEAVLPKRGDAVTDALIHQIGEGSEKIIVYVGRNQERMGKLQQALQADPTGIKATMLIGEWKGEINAPAKRKTNAPEPAPGPGGQQPSTSAAEVKRLKKAYDQAHKNKDAQKAYNAKKKAKAAGVDVTNW